MNRSANKNNKISGIYEIVNLLNNKKYIGSSQDVELRFYEHKYDLKNGKHHNKYLQNSWNINGENNFEFRIIEFCSTDIILEREQFYIDNYNSEYNAHKIAGSSRGFKLSEETKKKIGNKNKGRKPSKEAIENSVKARVGKPVWNSGTTGCQVAWNKGKKHSEEQLSKMIGQKKSDLTKQKLCKAWENNKEERGKKISEGWKRRKERLDQELREIEIDEISY